MTRTLLLIGAALALMVGSFIWFVVTWDRAANAPVSLILPEILPPEGRSPFTTATSEVFS